MCLLSAVSPCTQSLGLGFPVSCLWVRWDGVTEWAGSVAMVGGEPRAVPPPPARAVLAAGWELALHPCIPESPWGWAVSKVLPGALGRLRWRPSAADMVVFLGRRLPVLLEVFKKKGEWVWLWRYARGDSSLRQTLWVVGMKARRSGEVGVPATGSLQSEPACGHAFVRRLCCCLCLSAACDQADELRCC